MTRPPTITVGLLPTQFEPADAGPVITLAAAVVAAMAAFGNEDPDTVSKILHAANQTMRRMRPEARDSILSAASEMIDAAQKGKHFMVAGGFKDRAKSPGPSDT